MEIEAERSKDLIGEVASCPMGKELIELLNRAAFLPQLTDKTVEEMKVEAEKEEEEMKKHDEELRQEGRREMLRKVYRFVITKKRLKHWDTLEEMEKDIGGEEESKDEEVDKEEDSIVGIRGIS